LQPASDVFYFAAFHFFDAVIDHIGSLMQLLVQISPQLAGELFLLPLDFQTEWLDLPTHAAIALFLLCH
jgi:hypothetical protein